MILPPTAAVETFVETLSRLDGLLLTGGGDVCPAMYGEKRGPGLKDMDPQRDACETAALREARKRGLPVLGICRGIQIMAVAFGGTLYRDLPSEKEGASGHWQQMPRQGTATTCGSPGDPGSFVSSKMFSYRSTVIITRP